MELGCGFLICVSSEVLQFSSRQLAIWIRLGGVVGKSEVVAWVSRNQDPLLSPGELERMLAFGVSSTAACPGTQTQLGAAFLGRGHCTLLLSSWHPRGVVGSRNMDKRLGACPWYPRAGLGEAEGV